jgi:choline dehydrogenase-like flavoprotein
MPTRLFASRLANETVGAVHENTHVEKLLVDGGRVSGVRTTSGWEVEADHVVLAAGALESPRLVLASELREVISIKGLMDHPALCFAVRAPGSNHHGVGLVLERDDMQIISMHEGDRVTIVGAALRVFSRGHVELHGGECHFDFRMLDDPRDVLLLGRCLEDMIQLALGSGASVTCGTEQTSLERVRSMTVEERISWMRRNVSGNWHAACSLPMGGGTLVDHNGRVRDTPNLWCCDASVMCDLPRATTQLPVMAVAAEIGKRFAINYESN